MQKALFITFEGSEGCGKSTQILRLSTRLQSLHLKVVTTREPGGTPLGEEIRHLIQFSDAGREMKPHTELLLFAASRAELVRKIIEPALNSGATVLADRFFDSTSVYQGVARKIDKESVKFINEFAVGKCKPDITFVLDLDLEKARQRLMRRPRSTDKMDRMEQEPTEFYEKVRAGYLKLAADEPERVHVIDASQSVSTIEEEIWNHLQKKFNGIFQESSI